MKGRVFLVFWLVFILAALTAVSSYAWLAINASTAVRGIKIETFSDSLYLEISADKDAGYGTEISYNRAVYSARESDTRLHFVTYARLPNMGAIRITPIPISSGNYNGSGTTRYYKAIESEITGGKHTFVDVTDSLTDGQSLEGLFTIFRGDYYPVSNTDELHYYYEQPRNGSIDYVCIGTVAVGEPLAGRVIWGYAKSDDLNDPQVDNVLSFMCFDVPPPECSVKQTVYLRCAEGTSDAKMLRVSSVEIEGQMNYLTDAIRVMFVATSESGHSVIKFYSRRDQQKFDGLLFETLRGNTEEVITVDMYVFFDGTDINAYDKGENLTKNDVLVKFEINDHSYN